MLFGCLATSLAAQTPFEEAKAHLASARSLHRKFLLTHILLAMQNPQQINCLVVNTKIETAITIGQCPQSLPNPIPRHAGKSASRHPFNFVGQVFHKRQRRSSAAFGDKAIDTRQIRHRLWSED